MTKNIFGRITKLISNQSRSCTCIVDPEIHSGPIQDTVTASKSQVNYLISVLKSHTKPHRDTQNFIVISYTILHPTTVRDKVFHFPTSESSLTIKSALSPKILSHLTSFFSPPSTTQKLTVFKAKTPLNRLTFDTLDRSYICIGTLPHFSAPFELSSRL
jgi:hypothetical protein